MGTKQSPGAYDCYARAEPDEPLFVLLARDVERAPDLVRLWAAISAGDPYSAQAHFTRLVNRIPYREPSDPKKVAEAYDCAQAMESWAERREYGS